MTVRILLGDVREKLADLPDESVHCVVTSPPYFGLRDYGTASWQGGDADCDHSPEKRGGRFASPVSGKQASNAGSGTASQRDCPCGATRTDKQIGLEPTPAEFVAVMVEVFREVRRVLRKDGTLWLNLGDSYAAGKNGRADTGEADLVRRAAAYGTGAGLATGPREFTQRKPPEGLKAKDLIGVPWRVAFALQADGWYLRQDIIWAKPNPMPESVTDRCTKAHEYLFLLSKSARYHYDGEAIAEAAVHDAIGTGRGGSLARVGNDSFVSGEAHKGEPWTSDGTRNRRSVWTVATQPFKEAHFATFPPDLIEPCIKAGCPKDCCAKCGAPVVRDVERTKYEPPVGEDRFVDASRGDKTRKLSGADYAKQVRIIGESWLPSCSCDAGLTRGTVLDPFGGAGTTGLVADRLQRDAILIELNPTYAEIARQRLSNDSTMFADVLVA